MQVMMTGHRNYIGPVAAPLVAAAGHEMIGLDRGLYSNRVVARAQSTPNRRTDIRDIESPDLSRIAAVIHFAVFCNDPLGDRDPALGADLRWTAIPAETIA